MHMCAYACVCRDREKQADEETWSRVGDGNRNREGREGTGWEDGDVDYSYMSQE